MYVLSSAAINLASAGPLAIGILVGMVAAIALLAAGAAALGPALTAGAVGMIAFGVAIVLVATGALIASAALAVVASVLPVITQYGMQGAAAIAVLGAGMIVFGAGAAVAGAACIVLGAGLVVVGAALAVVGAAVLITAAGVLALAAGSMVLGAGLTLVSASLLVTAAALPVVAAGALGKCRCFCSASCCGYWNQCSDASTEYIFNRFGSSPSCWDGRNGSVWCCYGSRCSWYSGDGASA